jgi:hypothetical protein
MDVREGQWEVRKYQPSLHRQRNRRLKGEPAIRLEKFSFELYSVVTYK